MTKHFWYRINEAPDKKSCEVKLLVSPGHYGRGLSTVYSNIELIKEQLKKGNITYDSEKHVPGMILLEENEEPQIEIGNTDFDKSVMRTLLSARTSASKETLEKSLKEADFFKRLPHRL